MKYQKSSIPYMTILAFFLIGLPLTDYNIDQDLRIEVSIVPMELNKIECVAKEDSKGELFTHSMHVSVPK